MHNIINCTAHACKLMCKCMITITYVVNVQQTGAVALEVLMHETQKEIGNAGIHKNYTSYYGHNP